MNSATGSVYCHKLYYLGNVPSGYSSPLGPGIGSVKRALKSPAPPSKCLATGLRGTNGFGLSNHSAESASSTGVFPAASSFKY